MSSTSLGRPVFCIASASWGVATVTGQSISGGVTLPLNGFNRVGMQNSYNWEILEYNTDGVVPYDYPGSDESSTYKITLKSISIPNVPVLIEVDDISNIS